MVRQMSWVMMPDRVASVVTVTHAVGPIGGQLARSVPNAGSITNTRSVANARSSSYSRSIPNAGSIANAGSSSRARPIACGRECGGTIADRSCAWARPRSAAG
jgi:hypothetical protein